jgi:hypothetical protein
MNTSTPKEPESRICEGCGAPFTPDDPRQSYHDRKCQKASFERKKRRKKRDPQPRSCAGRKLDGSPCTEVFMPKRASQKFHSDECQKRTRYLRDRKKNIAEAKIRYWGPKHEEVLAKRREAKARNRDKVNAEAREYYRTKGGREQRKVLAAERKRKLAEYEELRKLRGAGMLAPRSAGGRPKGMTKERQQKAHELLRYMQAFIDKMGHDDGSIPFAAVKAYPGITRETASQRARKTLKDYRKFVEGQKPPS